MNQPHSESSIVVHADAESLKAFHVMIGLPLEVWRLLKRHARLAGAFPEQRNAVRPRHEPSADPPPAGQFAGADPTMDRCWVALQKASRFAELQKVVRRWKS